MKQIFLSALLWGIALLLSACGSAAPPSATSSASKPVVQITAPAYGSSFFEGDAIAVKSVSTDPSGVARVELYIDGQLANTQLSPSPQGTVQFTVAQEWLAKGLGAHTVSVRAFNTAEVSGEASVPIAVNPRVAAQPTATTVEEETAAAPTETTAPEATLPAETPTAPAVDTETPPADTETPTAAPADTETPTPTPTNPVIVFLPPFDGGMNVSVSWSDNGLFIRAEANDVAVGQDNGDGIRNIDFFIQDLNGNVIASKRENNRPYCYFGETNGECISAEPGTNDFKWRDGRPIQPGWYFVRAVAYTPDNRIQVAERPVNITLPVDTSENLFVNFDKPFSDRIEGELEYEASVSGQGVDNNSGQGIQRVDMYVVDYNGKKVSAQPEQNPFYCGFGDGGRLTPCTVYNFRAKNLKWPNGDRINPTQYILRAIVFAQDGRIAANTSIIQIDRLQ